MSDKRAMRLPPCIKCKMPPTAYKFPSGYRQIGCFECNRIIGGNDADDVAAKWKTDNKKSGAK